MVSGIGLRVSQRGSGSTVAVVIMILFVVTVLGLSYMDAMKAEATLTARATESAVARYAAEAAIEEALVTVRAGMNRPGTPWFDRFRLPLATGSFTAGGDPARTLEILRRQSNGQAGASCVVAIEFKAWPFPDIASSGYGADPVEKAGVLTVRATAVFGSSEVLVSTAWDAKVVSTAPPEPLAGSALFCLCPSASPVKVLPGTQVSTLDPSSASAATSPSAFEVSAATGAPRIAVSRISRFFGSLEEMKGVIAPDGVMRLEGVNLVNLPRPGPGPFPSRDLMGLRVKGSGSLVFMNTALNFSVISQEGPIGLQMLNGGDLTLSGALTGFVFAPGSTLSAGAGGFTLDGAALVSDLSGWSTSGPGSSSGNGNGLIRHGDTSGHIVSISRQSMGWRRL